jgi:hypothetical protein
VDAVCDWLHRQKYRCFFLEIHAIKKYTSIFTDFYESEKWLIEKNKALDDVGKSEERVVNA